MFRAHKKSLAALGAVAVLAAATSTLPATADEAVSVQAQPAHMTGSPMGQYPMGGAGQYYGMGPGMMMYPGMMMNPGMMGMMMNPGMMGMMNPGMMGMMGRGYGMNPMARSGEDYSADDVRGWLETMLKWHGNARLKIGEVKESDDDTILADIVTQDGSLVQRYKNDRHNGWMQPAE